jgi:ketosteroid isomerase-like protein
MKKFLFYWFLVLMSTNTIKAQATNQKTSQDSITMNVLVGFAKAFNAHDVNAILSFMSDDCIFLASAGPDAYGEKFEGIEAVKKAFEDVFKTYPDAHWGNVSYVVAGNRTVTEWLFTGTRADGSRVEVNGCDLCTFRDGKIVLKNSFRKNRPAIPKQ